MKIQANTKGSRFIEVTPVHMETIRRYNLFRDFLHSDGYIDDTTVEKLQRLCRQLLENGHSEDQDLINLCVDVIFHKDMKPLGLRNLMQAYISEVNQGGSPLDSPLPADKDDDSGFNEAEIDDFIKNLDFDFTDLK